MFNMVFFILSLAFSPLSTPSELSAETKFNQSELVKENTADSIRFLEDKICGIEEEIEKMKKATTDNESEISEMKNKYVYLNFKESDGFQMIKTAGGNFYIKGKEAIPYLNGYKIVITIGNPYQAHFCSPKFQVRWNVPYSSNNMNIYEWIKNAKEKEFNILNEVVPGKWTDLELFLNPCEIDELQRVRISLDFGSIKLST